MTIDEIRAIERAAYLAWPAAETVEDDGWELRSALGFSRRANSVHATNDTKGFEAKLGRAASFYAMRGLPLIFRVTPLCGAVDPRLEHIGFAKEAPTDVMVTDLSRATSSEGRRFSGSRLRSATRVRVTSEPTSEWFTAQGMWLGVTDRVPWEGILRRSSQTGAAGFGLLVDAHRPVAAGLAVLQDEWVGLFEISVAPAQRRRGYGRALSAGLLSWASAAGAKRGYLQVMESNVGARRLYGALGFMACYTYWYRRAPPSE